MKLRAPVRGLAPGTAPADAELVRYVCTVHRMALGETFVAFDPSCAVEADAHLEREGAGAVLHVGELRPAAVVARRQVILIQGLPKGDKCDAIVRDATELGATAVHVVPMARSVARPNEAKLGARESRWRRIADEASRQCGRGDAATVDVLASLEAAIAAVPQDAARFVLWERAEEPLGPPLTRALEADRGLVFVVGPEGGLEPDEVRLCESNGFLAVSLGRFILRTETVAAAVLGAAAVIAPG